MASQQRANKWQATGMDSNQGAIDDELFHHGMTEWRIINESRWVSVFDKQMLLLQLLLDFLILLTIGTY